LSGMIKNHALYLTALSDVKQWISDTDMDVNNLMAVIHNPVISPKQSYEVNSYYRCVMLYTVVTRLRKIREMVNRKFYRKKKDNPRELAIEYHINQYYIYSAVYQSGMDVSLRLVNAVLHFNYPHNNGLRGKILNSAYVKDCQLGRILLDLGKKTKTYRDIKNLLLHEGKGSRPPINLQRPSGNEIKLLSKEYGQNSDFVKSVLNSIFTSQESNILGAKMDKESNNLENIVRRLMDELLPHYNRIHTDFS